ncbi:hypothetical protein [Nocardioides marmoraquaticus]
MSRSRVSTTCRTPARSVRADALLLARTLLLVLALALGLLTGCERGTELEPPRGATAGGGAVEDGAATVLRRLEQAIDDRDVEAAAAVATPQAADLLAAVVDNARALDVRDVSLRYVAPDAPATDGERERLGDDVVAVRARLGFAYAGVDRRPVDVESRVLLLPGDDGPRVADLGGVSAATPPADADPDASGAGTRTPLWFSTPLTVVREGSALLAVAGDDAGRYPGLAARAVEQVRQVLPRWDGDLVVEVPADADQLDAVLAAPDGRFDAIAGLAATVDGSAERGTPVRVYLNPGVFGALSRRGAQVVLTHEATHVAVEAPYASMPVWLLEGFADYVALAGGRVPVDVAARQVLQRVREEGLPDGLPTSADLDPSAPGLGATYEEAWLACRYLGAEFGQDALVRLYEVVDDGTPAPRAFRDVLGTTEQRFVQGWRRDLAGLAGVAG